MIRFPLVVLVAFGHCYNAFNGLAFRPDFPHMSGPDVFVQYYLSRVLTSLIVPLFFMMAAYLLFSKFDGSLKSYQHALTTRVRTLFVPFLFWNVAVLLFLAFAQANPLTGAFFSGRYAPIASYTLFDHFSAIFGYLRRPVAYQFWFVRDLMLLVVLSPFVLQLVKRPVLFLVFVPVLFVAQSAPAALRGSNGFFLHRRAVRIPAVPRGNCRPVREHAPSRLLRALPS